MTVKDITNLLEDLAPLSWAEEFDNVGLLVGDPKSRVSGVLVSLDTLENVVEEAIAKNANMIVSFHPIIFKGLKQLTPTDYVSKVVLKCIQHGISIYSMHTALDNASLGVNHEIAERLGLQKVEVLINNPNLKPQKHEGALGMGRIGLLPEAMEEKDFLKHLKAIFGTPCIKHSQLVGKKIKKVAVLGGSGAFAIDNAKHCKADAYVTSDLKYHDFFKAENNILLADIGHYESEQFTKNLLVGYLTKKIPNFAISLSESNTNPIKYY